MLFLIDAYNVIFNGRKLQKLALSDPPAAREKFLNMVIDFCEREDERAIIIYDGGCGDKAEIFHNDKRVKAYYAGGEADPMIIAMAPKLFKHNPEFIVVSSDNEIRGHCGQMGVKTIGAMTFRKQYLSGNN